MFGMIDEILGDLQGPVLILGDLQGPVLILGDLQGLVLILGDLRGPVMECGMSDDPNVWYGHGTIPKTVPHACSDGVLLNT